jgi:LPS-assembly lipoprotein
MTRRVLPLLLAAVLLSSCGFHLQGRTRLPATLAVVRLEGVDPQSDFFHALRRSLLDSGAKLDDNGTYPDAVLVNILADASSTKVLTVSALNVPTEYEFSYAVKFSVKSGAASGGKELIAPEDLSLVREYDYSEATVLAREREQDVFRDALGKELASVVMRRLASL